MKIPEMNKVYVLNPHYHLRHDIHRVALFSSTGTDTDCSRNWHTFIHPLQAVMLSFFTYDRPLQTTLPLLCDFFCRSKEEMIKWVSDFIDNPTPIYTSSQQGEIYFPKRILIEAEKAGKALRFDRLQANSFVWKKLDLTTRRLYSGPLLLTFMLTNQCVTHCKYCYADTSTQIKSPLTTQRMMELIKEASDLQVQQVNLIGGEIFLHKDWKIILKELVKRGIAPEFISTKMPVTQKLLQDVQETGYQGIVQISLDAIHSEILTASLGVNGNYAKEMLHGLQLLDDSGLNYQISSVLTNYNCQGSRCFKGSECSALTTHMFILPDGKVTVCEQLYWHPQFIIGNVTTQSLKEVWHSPQALHLCSLSRQDINKESPCRECRLFEDCFSYQNRCWSDIIKAYGKDCWDFPDPRCCFAPAMKNKLSYD